MIDHPIAIVVIGQLISLGIDDLTSAAYSELCCSHWLWSRVTAERVLLFQTDALLCHAGIDDFQEYDYVGAPFNLDESFCKRYQHADGSPHADTPIPWLVDAVNGGLSLRSRHATLAVLDAIDFRRGQTEVPTQTHGTPPK